MKLSIDILNELKKQKKPVKIIEQKKTLTRKISEIKPEICQQIKITNKWCEQETKGKETVFKEDCLASKILKNETLIKVNSKGQTKFVSPEILGQFKSYVEDEREVEIVNFFDVFGKKTKKIKNLEPDDEIKVGKNGELLFEFLDQDHRVLDKQGCPVDSDAFDFLRQILGEREVNFIYKEGDYDPTNFNGFWDSDLQHIIIDYS